MAAKHNVEAPVPLKIIKWKVRKESHISKGTVLALYHEMDGKETPDTKKLKASFPGIIAEVLVKEDTIVQKGLALLRLSSDNGSACTHPTIMKDMCADCGMDLRETLGLPGDRKTAGTATVAMVHSIPELIVSEEQAMEIGKEDENRLLQQRKLVLLVDLDQTLIHTTNDNIPPNLKDVKHFQLWHGRNRLWYHTRFRPFTLRFIEAISKMYELHICTFGVRMYAHIIARLIDPDEKYFSHRILSRDECFDAMSKTANLKALFPCGDKTVCIIDDREDVWNFAPNLVHVKPYRFFQGTADINAPPGLTKKEHDSEPMLHKVVDHSTNKSDGSSATAKQGSTSGCENMSVDGGEYNSEKSNVDNSKNECLQTEDAGDTIHTSAANVTEQDDPPKESEKQQIDEKCVMEGGEGNSNAEEQDTYKKKDEAGGDNADNELITGNDSCKGKDSSSEDCEVNSNVDMKTDDSPKKTSNEDELEWEDADDYLLHLEEILTRIHTAFYDLYEQSQKEGSSQLPDLKNIVPYVRKKVLKGANIVFSGMVPLNMPLEKSRAYTVATSLGATVQMDFVAPSSKSKDKKDPDATTHLVVAKSGTGKHKNALKMKHVKVVQGNWLWVCSERWEWVDEKLYPLEFSDSVFLRNENSKKRKPEKGDSSSSSCEEESAAKRLKEECSTEKTVSDGPIVCFSDEELQLMDKEVNDMLEDEDISSDETDEETEGKLREKVLGISEESDSDDSLSGGDYPRGWGIRRKSFETSTAIRNAETKEKNTDCEDVDEDERENEFDSYQKNTDLIANGDSSTSVSEESIGSVDDEIADAVEREFLGT